MTVKKKILQLGGGPLHVHSVKKMQRAGYEVHVLDKNPDAPCKAYADNFAAIDIADTEGIKAYSAEHGIDGIMAINDAGIVPAADASAALGLHFHSPETARDATDKGRMRERWAEKGLSQPEFIIVTSADDIRGAIQKIGYPCILKPCYNWGSRGITAIFDENDADFAINFALENNRNGRFIIEEFIPGTEMTIEGLAKNGEISILSKSDKVHQDHPRYRVAMELNYPAKFSKEKLAEVDKLVIDAAKALGIKDGAIHCECMVNDKGAYLVEMAGRPGGGHIFGQIVEAQSGVEMPVALAKLILQEDVDIKPKFQKGVSYRFFAPPKGVFQSVKGIEEAKSIPGVLDIGFSMEPGTVVDAIAGDADRPGYLVTTADTRDEAVQLAENVLAGLTFIMNN
jgi:biotin carboxylase